MISLHIKWCRMLSINIIMPIDVYSVRIRLLITWWKEIHLRYTLHTSTCSSAAPPNPVLVLEVFVHSEHQGGTFLHQKRHLSPSWTFPMHHLQLPSLRLPTPIVACYQVVTRSPTISQSFQWIFWEVLGSTGINWWRFFGGGWLMFFQNKGTICWLSNLWFIKVVQRKIIWTIHLHLNFPGCKGCSFLTPKKIGKSSGAPFNSPHPLPAPLPPAGWRINTQFLRRCL